MNYDLTNSDMQRGWYQPQLPLEYEEEKCQNNKELNTTKESQDLEKC